MTVQGLISEVGCVRSCAVQEGRCSCGRPSDFDVVVQTSTGTHTVARTYDDFQNLQKSLSMLADNLPEFPPRQSIMTMVSPTARSERMQGLECYLAAVLKHFSNKTEDCPELAEFVGHSKSALLSSMSATELQQTDCVVDGIAVHQNEEPPKRPFQKLPSVGTWLMRIDKSHEEEEEAEEEDEVYQQTGVTRVVDQLVGQPSSPLAVDQPSAPLMRKFSLRKLSTVGGVGGWTWLANHDVDAAGQPLEGEKSTEK